MVGFCNTDFGRIKYFINEEKGTVVAKFNGVNYPDDASIWRHLLRKVLWKISDDTSNITHIYGEGCRSLGLTMDSFDSEVNEYLSQQDKLYGIAKCSPEDKFDAEIGKEIARKKLLAKYFKFEKHILDLVKIKFTKFVTEYFGNLGKRIELCDSKISKNTIKP